MKDRVIFNLKRNWEVDGKIVDLYEEIKAGRKTSEWRDASWFWIDRLAKDYILLRFGKTQNLTQVLKIHRAWFVVGYPKGNVPRLEADITGLIYHIDIGQLEIQFANVQELKRF